MTIETATSAAEVANEMMADTLALTVQTLEHMRESQGYLRDEIAELVNAQGQGGMVADYVQAHPPEEFYARERQVQLARAGNAELAPGHCRDRDAEDAAEQDAAPVVQDIVVSHAGMLDTRKLTRPAARPPASAQLSERLFDEPSALQLSAADAETEVLRLAATRNKQQSKHYHEHDCSDEDDPSVPEHGSEGGTGTAEDIMARYHEYFGPHDSQDSPHGNHSKTHDVPESEWGQRTKGPWSSYHAPLRGPKGTTVQGRKAGTYYAPHPSEQGQSADLDAGGGAAQ